MGKSFGQLSSRVRGTITYSLSPMEQKTFGGIFSRGVPNMLRRFYSQVFRVAPPFVVAYLIYDWGEKENDRLSRKNPADFEHET